MSLELVEFVGKCILEEIFQWIECKEVENLAFKDVNVDQLSDVLSTSTEDLINKGFTIFQAVHDFYKGTIHILRKHLYSTNLNLIKTVCGLKFQKKMYTSGKFFFVQIVFGSEKST